VVSGRRIGLVPDGLRDSRPIGYSQAVVSSGGVLVHIAGQVADAPTAAGQVEAALEAVDKCCRAAGGSISDLVSMTWFTTEDVSELWGSTAEIRARLLPDPPPAATSVRVAALADPRYRVEITAVAVVTGSAATAASDDEEDVR
jgi:enamine deaminase RidA (YjgF/YER057c/UK114 family)